MPRPIAGPSTVSVIIPVYRAEATIARAITSLLAQTHPDWEAILVSDDGVDHLARLSADGIADPRLFQVSTGAIASGCTHARNIGFREVRGGFVTRLDADDLFHPRRLERLLPIAEARGCAIDDMGIVDDATGRPMWSPFAGESGTLERTASELALTHCPFVPLVARPLAPPWFEDVDISEDVLFLFALEERVERFAVLAETLYEYRIRAGSMCHGPDGAERAERSYLALEGRLAGAGFPGIGPAAAARAQRVFAEKRAFNRAFADALGAGRVTNFQEFCVVSAGRSSS